MTLVAKRRARVFAKSVISAVKEADGRVIDLKIYDSIDHFSNYLHFPV